MVEAFWGDGAPIKGYLARPAAGPARAGIVVCAAEDGATEFLRGVTRRLAKDGYAALLPDPLSRAGGTAAVPAAQRPALQAAPGAAAHRLADLRGGVAYLQAEAGLAADRIGLLGFGFGGLVAWEAAQGPLAPGGRALVVYGARPASLTHPDRLDAAVQAHYGALDHRALGDLPDLERRLREAGCVHDLRVHAGLGPAFWERWSADAAATGTAASAEVAVGAAWSETLRWFATHLAPRAPSGPSTAPPARTRPN